MKSKTIIYIILFSLFLFSGPLFSSSRMSDKDLVIDNDGLYYLGTDRKLGILTNTPKASLDVNGSTIFRQHAGFYSEYSVDGTGGGNIYIDWNNGNKQRLTIGNSDITIYFTNISIPELSCTLTLVIVHSGTGQVTWSGPGTTLWPGGQLPVLSTSDIDIINFYYYNGLYYGIPTYGYQ